MFPERIMLANQGTTVYNKSDFALKIIMLSYVNLNSTSLCSENIKNLTVLYSVSNVSYLHYILIDPQMY
jgi:hypothetical protein